MVAAPPATALTGTLETALTMHLALGLRAQNPRPVRQVLDAVLRYERATPGTFERSTSLRLEIPLAAYVVRGGLVRTNLQYGLVGGLVSLMALITAWVKDPLLKLGLAGWITGALLAGAAATVLAYFGRKSLEQRAWKNCEDKVKLLSTMLKRRGTPPAMLIAQELDDALAGAPMP